MYNQYDNKWKGVAIGSKTLGTDGCLVASIAEGLSTQYGILVTPEDVVKDLTPAGFTPGGLLIWSAINRAYKQLYFLNRVSTELMPNGNFGRETMSQAISTAERAVRMGQVVLLNVDNLGNGRQNHWVILKDVDGVWTIGDPDGGKEISFHYKYGEREKGVYGYAVIAGEPGDYPRSSERMEIKAGKVLGKLGRGLNDKDLLEQMVRESIDVLI